MKYEKSKEEFKTEEFDKQVKIIEVDEALNPTAIEPDKINKVNVVSDPKKADKIKSVVKKNIKRISSRQQLRQPSIEDSEGFDNQRRPLIDPFRIGEKIVHEVSYLGASAGLLSFVVKPFAIVNGAKNYNFFIDIKSNKFFTRVYAVEDQVQTYLDYESLIPGAFKLDIRDAGQVKEARSFFDYEKMKANYWEHRYTEKHGHEEKKTEWQILPYSQNPFSAIFYMRIFKWTIGKEYQFRVADDEKNVIFKAKALEKTLLKTSIGDFNAIKLKAEVVTSGNLSKARDFFIWVSDDERKFILKIEVDLPIGSLVSEVVEINAGK